MNIPLRSREKLEPPLPDTNPVPDVLTDSLWAAVVGYINQPDATLKQVAAKHGVSVERLRASIHYAAKSMREVRAA